MSEKSMRPDAAGAQDEFTLLVDGEVFQVRRVG